MESASCFESLTVTTVSHHLVCIATLQGREARMEVSELALQLWDYVHFVCTITTSIIIGNNWVASKEHISRSFPSVSWPDPDVKDLLSKESSHEDSNLVILFCDLAVFCCLLSPSSGRPAILATILGTSARCCSAVWAVVLASVVCACHWMNTAPCCCIASCKSRTSCLLCATVHPIALHCGWHSTVSFHWTV